jgi:hypothetical protein
MVRLHTENQLPMMPGSASKVCVGGGGWVVESEFSDRFGYSLRLALAKPNKMVGDQNTYCKLNSFKF